MKILIVEDELAGQKLLQLFLKGLGEIEVTGDGESALARFQKTLEAKEPFDLVLLDIMLPQLSGLQVLAGIRSLESSKGIGGLDGVKVIMLTALHDSENIMKSFRLQAEAYISKPIDKEKLLQEIRKLGFSLKSTP